MSRQKSKSKKIEIAKLMPPILEFVWDHIKQSGYIEYNPDSGKWQGVDYNED